MDEYEELPTQKEEPSYVQRALEEAFKGLEQEFQHISGTLNGSLQGLLHGYASLYDTTNHLMDQHVLQPFFHLY